MAVMGSLASELAASALWDTCWDWGGAGSKQDFLLEPDGLLVAALQFRECLDLSSVENFAFPCRKVPSLRAFLWINSFKT